MNATLPTREQCAPHVDHDVAQFILLHHEMRKLRYCLYPEVVRRAVVVAYATHLRALLEFFHGHRPAPDDMRRVGCEERSDIEYATFAKVSPQAWTNAEMKRLCDADKLAGHLSTGRITREGKYPPWGTDEDWNLLASHIRTLLKRLDAEPHLLKRSFKAAQKHGLR